MAEALGNHAVLALPCDCGVTKVDAAEQCGPCVIVGKTGGPQACLLALTAGIRGIIAWLRRTWHMMIEGPEKKGYVIAQALDKPDVPVMIRRASLRRDTREMERPRHAQIADILELKSSLK